MNIEEKSKLLGYQLRQPVSEIAMQWPQERRSEFLLNEGVAFPLSADDSVWKIFDAPDLSGFLFEDFDSDPFSAPNGLNLFRLGSGLEFPDDIYEGASAVLVAFTASPVRADELCSKHFIREQRAMLTGMELVGFDVCDNYLTSGLSNCGVSEHDKSDLKRKFGSLLNEFGLFKNPHDATEFAHIMNGLVKEHAPFDWIGLYVRTIK